jgi:hypothetical protein
MALINGAHTIIYSTDAEADRIFFKDVLKFKNIDVGGGWLIFKLPPSELAFHPHSENDFHQLYLMTDDIEAFVEEMKSKKVKCSKPKNQGWGIISDVTLPGGGKIGVYEPKHARAK